MKNALWLCMMTLVGAFAGPADAIYKCTTSKGVIYQDRPCRDGTESDVQLVIPTGELTPKVDPAQDDAARANAARMESHLRSPKPARTGGEPASGSAASARQGATPGPVSASDESRRGETRGVVEKSVPMTAEQARQADPTAKYYTTDASAPGTEMPEHMMCESPTGERRRFILTNGTLMSI